MKLTLREANTALKALMVFPKCHPKAAYDLSRWRTALSAAVTPLAEQERALIEEHGGKVMDDGGIKWPAREKDRPSQQAAYMKAWNELLDHETDIGREPVKLSAVIGPDESKAPEIAPELLAMLEKIIVE